MMGIEIAYAPLIPAGDNWKATFMSEYTDAEGLLAVSRRDPGRSERVVCVVEEPHNLLSIERTRDFKGRYHVLHGALSPLQGVGPDELRVQGLVARVRAGGVEEVILATSPTVEGEATAVYLARLLKQAGQKAPEVKPVLVLGLICIALEMKFPRERHSWRERRFGFRRVSN